MKLRLLTPLLALAVLLPAAPAHAGNTALVAWEPWRDGSRVSAGAKASHTGATRFTVACFLQRKGLGGVWWDKDQQKRTGVGEVLVPLSARYQPGQWRTKCRTERIQDSAASSSRRVLL